MRLGLEALWVGSDWVLVRVFLGRGGGRGCGSVTGGSDVRGRQALEGSRWVRTSPGRGKEWGKGVRTREVGSQHSTLVHNSFISKMEKIVTSLVVQWLRLRVAPAGGAGSIPEQGNKIPRATEVGWG